MNIEKEARDEVIAAEKWSTVHDLSPEDAAAVAAMRTMLEPYKGGLQGTAARKRFDEIMQHTPDAEGIAYEADTVGGVPGWWCRPPRARSSAAILYLHGGWYVWGSAIAYRNFVGHVAARAGVAAFVPDYRLAPEHPLPAAALDAQACYRGLVERGTRRIALVGDSAGGGLALALLSFTTASTAPNGVVPVGAVVLSPVTDMTLAGSSWETRAAADLDVTRSQAVALVRLALGEHTSADPLVSPLYGDLGGLPPIRVHVGGDELLLDDSLRYVERAVAAGVDAKVDVWRGMQHVFPTSVGTLSAAAKSLDDIGEFLAQRFDVT